MILFIDTISETTTIKIETQNGSFVVKEIRGKESQTEKLLISIDDLLREQNLSVKDIKSIVVREGDGSYTGLRVGIATANALAFSLNVPVIKTRGEIVQKMFVKKFEKCVLPEYSHEPIITKEKPRL